MIYDDFKACAINNNGQFPYSRYYPSLISHLNERKNCAISDVNFYHASSRIDIEQCIDHLEKTESLIKIIVKWIFFENDPKQCKKNVSKSKRASLQAELTNIVIYSNGYVIPAGYDARPIYKSSDE